VTRLLAFGRTSSLGVALSLGPGKINEIQPGEFGVGQISILFLGRVSGEHAGNEADH
jgi:hypothetical protein